MEDIWAITPLNCSKQHNIWICSDWGKGEAVKIKWMHFNVFSHLQAACLPHLGTSAEQSPPEQFANESTISIYFQTAGRVSTPHSPLLPQEMLCIQMLSSYKLGQQMREIVKLVAEISRSRLPRSLIFFFSLVQARSRSSVNLKDATGDLPTVATERNTCMSTPRTNHICARCAISPILTPAH